MSPEYAILREYTQDGFTTVVIDTTKATYQGMKWLEMNDFGRRKFENWLMLNRTNEKLKFVYA